MTTWTPTDVETMKELAAKGVSVQRIAVRLRRSTSLVRALAKEHGITLKTATELRKSMGLRGRYSVGALVDEHYQTGRY